MLLLNPTVGRDNSANNNVRNQSNNVKNINEIAQSIRNSFFFFSYLENFSYWRYQR